jgi:hypothetical protein
MSRVVESRKQIMNGAGNDNKWNNEKTRIGNERRKSKKNGKSNTSWT